MDKKQFIYNLCENNPSLVFYWLRNNNFEYAKEFFGEQKHNWHFGQPTCTLCHRKGTADVNSDEYCYQTSLREMVIKEDPLAYMKEFI